MKQLDDLLRKVTEMGGSDLYLKAGGPPLVRLHGEMTVADGAALSAEQAGDLSRAALSEEQLARFERERELDFSFSVADVGRFRGNVYYARGLVQSVFRAVPLQIRTLEELRVPPVCRYFAERPHGLVLVTGPTGSGRSTTLAALIDHINRSFTRHIITIEDPIEFVHGDKKSIVNQREIGRDVHSHAQGVRDALRQDPDVILVGDMRSTETIALALAAAELGHLVFGVQHTMDTPQTIDRLVDIFPQHQQQQIRAQLATQLVGVVSQTLVKAKDGAGRIAAFETLVGVPGIRALIRDGKTHQMLSVIGTGSKQGMMTMDQSLAGLVNKGLVNYDDALAQAHNLTEFHFLSGQDEEDEETSAPTFSPTPNGTPVGAPPRPGAFSSR